MPSIGESSDTGGGIRLGRPGAWLLLRSLPAVAALAASHGGHKGWAWSFLVSSAWADWGVGRVAMRQGWRMPEELVPLEALVDFSAFVWTPLLLAWAGGLGLESFPASLLFVLAGAWRLARFQIQGLVQGRYVGLPVTYNGYLFPAVALFLHALWPKGRTPAFNLFFLVAAAAMVSRRLRIPEF